MRVEPPPAVYHYVGGSGAPPGQPSSDEQRAESGNKHDLSTRKVLAARVIEFFKHTERYEEWHGESESEEEGPWQQALKSPGKGLNSDERAYVQAFPFLPTASLERLESMCPLGVDNSELWRKANGLPYMEQTKDCRKWRKKPSMRSHVQRCGEEVMLHKALEKYYELIDTTPAEMEGEKKTLGEEESTTAEEEAGNVTADGVNANNLDGSLSDGSDKEDGTTSKGGTRAGQDALTSSSSAEDNVEQQIATGDG